MIRRAFLGLVLMLGLVFVAAPLPAVAISVPQPARQFAVCSGSAVDFLGLEPWYSCVTKNDKKQIEIKGLNDIWLIILTLLEDVIKLGVYIATGFVIWGGIKYIKSQGDPSQLSQAKDVIRNAIIGLLITLFGVAIVEFIVTGFNNVPTP